MDIQEIIAVIVLYCLVLYGCKYMSKKSTYQTGGGGLIPRASVMPRVEYINGPYESADERDPISFVVTI